MYKNYTFLYLFFCFIKYRKDTYKVYIFHFFLLKKKKNVKEFYKTNKNISVFCIIILTIKYIIYIYTPNSLKYICI